MIFEHRVKLSVMDQQSFFGEEPGTARHFFESPTGRKLDSSQLATADAETQKDVMRHWFYSNFEDPVNNTPYDSAEGGYVYIHGGPYEPLEELEGKFCDVVPEEVIEELAEELSNISDVWTGHNDTPDDEYLYESIVSSPRHFEGLKNSVAKIRKLLGTNVEGEVHQHFLRLLYVSAISALEIYLQENFISCINGDRALFRKFVETNPNFKEKKIPLSDVFKASEEMDMLVRTYLIKFVWHRLVEVKQMFRDTLKIDFPSDMGPLLKAIELRHDLVHRNGKDRDDKEHVLEDKDITVVLKTVEDFVVSIELQQVAF